MATIPNLRGAGNGKRCQERKKVSGTINTPFLTPLSFRFDFNGLTSHVPRSTPHGPYLDSPATTKLPAESFRKGVHNLARGGPRGAAGDPGSEPCLPGCWRCRGQSGAAIRGGNPALPFVCIPRPIAATCSPIDIGAISENLYKIQLFGIAMFTRGIHILSRVLFARAF